MRWTAVGLARRGDAAKTLRWKACPAPGRAEVPGSVHVLKAKQHARKAVTRARNPSRCLIIHETHHCEPFSNILKSHKSATAHLSRSK